MKALIIGVTGLAGQSFRHACEMRGINVIGISRNNKSNSFDVSNSKLFYEYLVSESPDFIVNACAVTDINACEANSVYCWSINTLPLYALTRWSIKFSRPFIQISTDHYYVNGSSTPHTTDEMVVLLNQYAASKYAAESIALTSPYSLILRTSILGFRGWKKPTFFEWILHNLEFGVDIKTFKDAWTSSIDVDTFSIRALELLLDYSATGLINLASKSVYSKAMLINEIALQSGLLGSKLVPVSIADYAPNRACSLGLDVSRARLILDTPLPSMREVVSSLLNKCL